MNKIRWWEMALFIVTCAGIMIACAFGYNSVVPAY